MRSILELPIWQPQMTWMINKTMNVVLKNDLYTINLYIFKLTETEQNK